jgi:hypothetical protein
MYTFTALCLALPALCAGAPVPGAWVHPGVFVSLPQLTWVGTQVRAGVEPFKAAFAKALGSPIGSLAYSPQGPPQDGIIDCGSYSRPNIGCSAEDSDASAAFLQLVLYSISGEAPRAALAVRILNAYARTVRYNNSNAPLQAGWGSSKWVRAAELASHLPGVGWPAAEREAFVAMLQRAALPLIKEGSGSNGNWELAMIEGLIGLAVLLEDAPLFDSAARMWRERIPAYFYNFALDGAKPVPAPRGHPSWYDQTVFSNATSGVAQETCRDEGHTSYSVASTANAAETARLQGEDLWAGPGMATRLATALEFNARLLLPGAKSPPDLCSGRAVDAHAELPTYEVAYSALALRRGISMPTTLEHILASVRTNENPVDTHMMVFETLTHGGLAPGERAKL